MMDPQLCRDLLDESLAPVPNCAPVQLKTTLLIGPVV
jgi:hypothetical protein